MDPKNFEIKDEKLKEYGDRLYNIGREVESIKMDNRKEMRKLHDKYSDQMHKLAKGNGPMQR